MSESRSFDFIFVDVRDGSFAVEPAIASGHGESGPWAESRALHPVLLAEFVALSSVPSINQFAIVADNAITFGSCFRIDDG
jgi:hypothetical protein